MRAFATSSVKAVMLVQRWVTPGAAGLVSATSGVSTPPSTALTTPATLPLWIQCTHGSSGCIGSTQSLTALQAVATALLPTENGGLDRNCVRLPVAIASTSGHIEDSVIAVATSTPGGCFAR